MAMKWNETVSSKCRYSEIVEKLYGEWDVLWELSDDDWQGEMHFIAHHKDGRYVYCQYEYGSCSSCDDWERRDLSDDDIQEEIQKCSMVFLSNKELDNWRAMLERMAMEFSDHGRSFTDRPINRINGIRTCLGLPKIKWSDL